MSGAPPAAGPATEDDRALDRLAAEYWEGHLGDSPVEATLLGDRRFDDRLPDVTPAGRERRLARLAAGRTAVAAIAPARLSDAGRVTRAVLLDEIESRRVYADCWLAEWTVDPRHGPQVSYFNLASLQKARTPEEGRMLGARWREMGPQIDRLRDNLERALGSGKVASRSEVARVIEQIDALLAQPVGTWALLAPANEPHPSWPAEARAKLESDVRAGVAGAWAAFVRYRTALSDRILPAARDDAHAGISHVPGGAVCYRRLIRAETSLDLAPEEIHHFGLQEIARVRGEMRGLGASVLGTSDLGEIQKRLRTDPRFFFRTRDEVEAKAREALARAQAALPRWIGRLPSMPCEVKRIEGYEEKDTTIAYYRQPASDGSRPGVYWVNTFAPETRPRYEAEVLAFHESVPGHHTQIALARELGALPAFRKHADSNAFVEGWALYSERLADEMGLYSADLDRMGMLSFDAWRASRLVVDTGIHAMGWTRRQAIDYMLENTLLAENNVVNEVDRYIGWPAQALGYKLGQREILRLRAGAQKRLGANLDLRAFHDAILGNGALPLGVLRSEMERWIAARE